MKTGNPITNTICVIIILINTYVQWNLDQNKTDAPGDAQGHIGPAMIFLLSMGITCLASVLLLLRTALTAIAERTFFSSSTLITIALTIITFISPLFLSEIF